MFLLYIKPVLFDIHYLHYFLLSHKVPNIKKVIPCKLTKVGWILIQKSDKNHVQIVMSTPSMTQRKIMSLALKNKCHILFFSELVCSCTGLCRILRNKFRGKKQNREKERKNGTTDPRRKREKIDWQFSPRNCSRTGWLSVPSTIRLEGRSGSKEKMTWDDWSFMLHALFPRQFNSGTVTRMSLILSLIVLLACYLLS